MKKTVALLLALLLCLGGALTVAAADLLSVGVSVLAEQSGMVKGAVAGDAVRFSATDFKQAMGIRRFDSITLTSLPDGKQGILYFGREPITVGASIPRASLDSLTFVPSGEGVSEACFSFTCDAYAGGAEVVCTIRFAERLNEAPTITDVTASRTVSTLAGVSAEGTLCASDPEGDALEFIVTSYPAHGTLTLTDSAYGDYVYTPTAGYVGSDSFTFTVRDHYGNYATPAEVSVTVGERGSTPNYRDLPTSGDLASLVLAEKNIMLGTLVGDGMYFDPDGGVSRADFLVMAMKAAGIKPRAGLIHTVFEDDGEIAEGVRPYVATAQELGYIIGTFGDGGLVLDPNEEISRGEAAVILSRVLGATVPVGGGMSYADSDTLPSAFRGATLALSAAGIYPRDEAGLLSVNEPLDRAAAAEMLYAAWLSKN